ncbi:hypothetical protein HCA64_06390 [Listeria booriae]|uniref:Uncharacterized protein n=1 Tax=Listeria booriae TaxID=1552123 RepID=A0A099WEZ3_9LIST|nr:hypothetical protein [Listeria booriae]KGL42675.1 hypothetical protein EP57_04235 [Listeria booriae]MBC1906098.1 hypothetical protein [Listeria booriae]STY40909.1 Uncharacterised protein [Listeria booriae]
MIRIESDKAMIAINEGLIAKFKMSTIYKAAVSELPIFEKYETHHYVFKEPYTINARVVVTQLGEALLEAVLPEYKDNFKVMSDS